MTSHTTAPSKPFAELDQRARHISAEELERAQQAETQTAPKRQKPDTRDLPPGLACRIDTAFLTLEMLAPHVELTEDHEQFVRDAVAMDWAFLRAAQKDGGAYAVLLHWGQRLGTSSFRILRNWQPETLHGVADRLIGACKNKAPDQLKELLKDLRGVDLVDDKRVAKLLLG